MEIWAFSMLKELTSDQRATVKNVVLDCVRDPDFDQSIEATPRHAPLAVEKFRILADALSKALGAEHFHVPRIDEQKE